MSPEFVPSIRLYISACWEPVNCGLFPKSRDPPNISQWHSMLTEVGMFAVEAPCDSLEDISFQVDHTSPGLDIFAAGISSLC
jgi:hypothetical protein